MVWTVESVRPLLERFDERVRYDMSRFDRLIGPARERNSVLRAPATEDDVARAEARLGVVLPPSYRAFLLVSNGAHASALGAEVGGGEQWRHGLLPIAEVRRTVDVDTIGVSVFCHELTEYAAVENDFVPVAGDPRPVSYYPPYEHGVVITHIHNGTDRLALVPRPGEEEWELWDFHWEGAAAHPSFADFLAWFAGRPDSKPKPENADAMVEAFLSGRAFTLYDLAEIADPRAVELGVKAIAEGTADGRVAELFRRLGDPEHIPAVERLHDQSDGWDRVQALVALEQLGADDIEQLLQADAKASDENVRSWARRRISERETQ